MTFRVGHSNVVMAVIGLHAVLAMAADPDMAIRNEDGKSYRVYICDQYYYYDRNSKVAWEPNHQFWVDVDAHGLQLFVSTWAANDWIEKDSRNLTFGVIVLDAGVGPSGESINNYAAMNQDRVVKKKSFDYTMRYDKDHDHYGLFKSCTIVISHGKVMIEPFETYSRSPAATGGSGHPGRSRP